MPSETVSTGRQSSILQQGADEGIRLVEFWLAPLGIIEMDFVQGYREPRATSVLTV